jgi:hypothetical protein
VDLCENQKYVLNLRRKHQSVIVVRFSRSGAAHMCGSNIRFRFLNNCHPGKSSKSIHGPVIFQKPERTVLHNGVVGFVLAQILSNHAQKKGMP